MKITTTIITILFPFLLLGQDCEFFPSDTVNICGYEYTLEIAPEEGSLTLDCENEQYLSITYDATETILAFSSCGIYELIYNATDGSCVDTLLIQVSDPNSTSINKNIDIGLEYGDIDCPGNFTASCYNNGLPISIPLGSGTPTPIWSFCTTTTCHTSFYTSDTVGLVNGCLADSIVTESFNAFSTSDYCSDATQDAFIVLDSEGDTVTDNTFLDYIAQLQDTTNLDCIFPGLECSFTNTTTCYDSIVMDTTLLHIPVRIGGQWTMPMIDTLQLYDTTYFGYSGINYELILAPGVEFYGPGDLLVELNEIYISNSNDTIRQYPTNFNLTLQWKEEWIMDTVLIIQEKYYDTNEDCFACGGFSSGSSFNVPEAPDFPCGPVSIYYPSICDCEYDEPNYSIQLINCEPRMWQLDLLSGFHYISQVTNASADISQNTAIISNPTHIYIDVEIYDYNGCFYYQSIYVEDYIIDLHTISSGDLSCETSSVNLNAYASYLSGVSEDLSNTVWSNGQIGSTISVSSEGNYTATFIDNEGCMYSASVYVNYDDTIDCDEENPLADTECNMDELDIICDIMTFDSFNYQMPSQSNGGNQPPVLCADGGVPNNISWFSFVAYSGNYSINVIPSDCYGSTEGLEGIQVGLYSDCSFSNSSFCSSECGLSNVAVPAQDLVEGQVYHMFIDGCSGSICNYEMEIEGNPEPPSLAPESMTLSSNGGYVQNANSGTTQEYCLGTDVQCSLDGVEIHGEYHWSVNNIEGDSYSGEANTMTEENDLSLTFNDKGTYEVCIDQIRNGCDLFTWTGKMCFTVKINHTEDEYFGSHFVCDGEESAFDIFTLSNLDPNEDGYLGIQNTTLNFQEGENTILAIDVTGCEYEQKFDLESLKFDENIFVHSDCSDDGIILDFSEYYSDLSTEEGLIIDIINPNGQFIGSGLDQNNYTIPHGSIDGEYIILVSKSNADITCETSKVISLNFTDLQPQAPLITNGPMALCAFEGIVTYIATNSDPNVDFIWSIDGDISIFTISGEHNENLSIDWKDSGGTISVAALNDCGLQRSTSNEITIHNSPVPTLTNEEETCSNQESVIIVEVEEDLIDTYNWDFQGATIISGSGLDIHSVSWDSDGPKEISLSIVDIYGCTQEIKSKILVNDLPVAEFSISSDSICVSESLTINTPITTQESGQNWEFDGGVNIGDNNPILTFDSPGWKTILLSIDNGSCTSEKLSHNVFVEKKMEEIELICMDQGLHSLQLEWNEVDGADGYAIKIGNQQSVNVSSNSYTATQLDENTEYDIEVSVITEHRCPPPVALSSCKTTECVSLDFTFDIPDMICIEEEMNIIELKYSVSNAEEGFVWSGENVTGATFDPNGLAAGVYELKITHSQEDCINNDIVEVRLISPPEFEIIYDEKICFGEETTDLEISISEPEYTVLIDGEVSDTESLVTPGEHVVVVMNNNMCASYKTIFIEESDEISMTIDGNIDIKEGEEHTYSIDETLISDMDINTFIWTINGTEYCSGSECLSINPSLEVDSEIELSALTFDGCEIITTLRVLVEELKPELVIPNIFSPNNDGINDYWSVTPNKDDITIQSIKILDRWNNLVYSQNGKLTNEDMKWDGKINGFDLQPGVYVYTISYSADNNIETVYGDITIIK